MSALAEYGITPKHDRIGEQRIACPLCDKGPRDDALGLKLDADGSAVWQCFRCGFRGAARGDRESIVRPPQRPQTPRTEDQRHQTLVPRWRDFWDECEPLIARSIGARYLEERNCVVPPTDGDLRWHPECWHWPTQQRLPAMVALITDVVTGAPLSLHFTYLLPDGAGKADVDKPRLLLSKHCKTGGVIRLWPDEAVTYSLGLAEGIESALSLAHAHPPVWATIDAGNLSALPVLAGIESVIVAVDHDPAGVKGAQAFGNRWSKAGIDVRLVMPADRGRDLNDVAQVAA